jgi:hypothetical protein
MIGAGAIAAEKIRLLSVTVARDPKEEDLLLKYDPERFDSCATINAHDPESLGYPLVTIKMLKIRWPWVRFMQGLRHLCSYTPHLSSFLLLLINHYRENLMKATILLPQYPQPLHTTT